MRNEVMGAEIERTAKLMIQGELMIGYYKKLAVGERDPKKKASYEMKVSQLELANEFNQGYVEHVGTLLAAPATKEPKKK